MILSPNMTDDHLQAVMGALPDEMSEAEICALTLTIYSAYLDNPAKVVSELISTIYAYGMSQGISEERISLALKQSAELREENPKTKH